jgi:hypothetical protein
MSSSPQDATTQAAASSGAQSSDATLDANAAQNQQFANQARSSLFGTYNPTTGTYSGGSESQFLNPSSLTQNGLQGTYLNQYNNATNNLANQTQDAVGTTMQSMANQGMGKSPAGYAADQERQALQTQAGQEGNLYAAAANGQEQQAQTNYANANNMLNSNATNTANLSVQGNTAAASNYASLYGTASTQVASPLTTVLGGLAGAGAGVGSAMTGYGNM